MSASFVKLGVSGRFKKVEDESSVEQRHELQKARTSLKKTSSDLALTLRKVAHLAPAKRQRVLGVVTKALQQMIYATSPGADLTKHLLNIIDITKRS